MSSSSQPQWSFDFENEDEYDDVDTSEAATTYAQDGDDPEWSFDFENEDVYDKVTTAEYTSTHRQ